MREKERGPGPNLSRLNTGGATIDPLLGAGGLSVLFLFMGSLTFGAGR